MLTFLCKRACARIPNCHLYHLPSVPTATPNCRIEVKMHAYMAKYQ